LLTATTLLVAVFIGLGLWQVQRLSWKEALLARIARHQATAPVSAPGRDAWPQINRDADEYRRVQLRGTFDHSRETLVQASTVYGTGHWVLTPLRTEAGEWVLVNRGFVPPELRQRTSRAPQEPTGPITVQGLLRITEPTGSALQRNAPAEGRWYSRDVAAIASTRGLPPAEVAPYFVDAVPAPGASEDERPRAGLTVLQFSNNHLSYALTWFAMAACLAVAFGVLWRKGLMSPNPHPAARAPLSATDAA
jgi:surfeit locus 1 family protein